MTAIDEIFKDFGERKGYVKPDPNATVIHLRLGDVIEKTIYSVEDMLIKGTVAAHAQQNFITIRSVYEYLDLLGNDTKVVIRGGSHFPGCYRASRVYANCLQRALAKAGKDVEMYLEESDGDKDFYFMANAKKFISSTGGFSNLIAQMVRRLGGEAMSDFRLSGTGPRGENLGLMVR